MTSKDFFTLLIRLLLGYIFLSSGLNKLTDGGFGHLIGPPHLIKDLAKYQLEKFGYFIAISQVLIGALVLSQRFSLIGLVAMMPMNVCIMAFTIAQSWGGTPIVNALLIVLNILALLYEWNSLKFLLVADNQAFASIPKTLCLFPNLIFSLIIIAIFIVTIILSSSNFIILKIIASIGFALVYFNIFQNKDFILTEKIVLIITLLSIIQITFGKDIFVLGINPFFIFFGCFVLGFLMLLISVYLRFRKAKNHV